MNIAHLLSQNQLTGAEVYACQLISEQISSQHKVLQISNGFFFPSLAEQIQLDVETQNGIQFWISVFKFKKILKTYQIHVVHSHSRAAAKLAYWATLKTQIAHVSTIHGRQHVSFSKKLINHYGQYQIPVCENIQKQLVHEFKYPKNKVKLLRNGVDLKKFFFKKSELNKPVQILRIAIIGRLSGPKKDRTLNFIKALGQIQNRLFSQYIIDIIGSEKTDLSFTLPSHIQINFTPHVELKAEFYQKYDLIVGSGRVCVESTLSGVACIAFGEAAYHGLIRQSNYKTFLESNFGDITNQSFGSPTVTSLEIETALHELNKLQPSELETIALAAEDEFSLKKINSKITKIYEMSYLNKIYSKWIPILMYHKIPNQDLDSVHKIFVNQSRFEKHLRFFKFMGFETLNFTDLQEFAQAKKPAHLFPNKPLILTFDDGYEDNLKNADHLLKKYKLNAQIFLLADATITHNNWDEKNTDKADKIVALNKRKEWSTSAFAIGSHGCKHERLTEMTDQDALQELIQSKQSLTDEFKKNVNVFAFTYGDIDHRSACLAETAGYDFAVNTDRGGLFLTDEPYSIFRVNIFPHETYFSLWKKTSSWYRQYYHNKRKQ